jgi:glyoxylase-like metal-dependent hydrolase (beta-lactamase superfamily II)
MPTSHLREILPDVFTWPWFSERHGYDFNGYLFRHSSGNVAVDPVEMPPEVLDELAEIGVAAVLITNRNHTRASRRLREVTGARVSIHPADAAYAIAQGASIDGELHIAERVGPFTILSVAGKSPGEVALHWPERQMLVVGDACVGKPPGECALLPESVMDDAALLRRSLARVARTTDFDVLLVGDGAPILRGGRAALERLVASFGGEGTL